MGKTLAEFAKERGVQFANICKTCHVLKPAVLKEVNEGLTAGLSAPTIATWLKKEHNVVVSDTGIRRHRKNCI